MCWGIANCGLPPAAKRVGRSAATETSKPWGLTWKLIKLFAEFAARSVERPEWFAPDNVNHNIDFFTGDSQLNREPFVNDFFRVKQADGGCGNVTGDQVECLAC